MVGIPAARSTPQAATTPTSNRSGDGAGGWYTPTNSEYAATPSGPFWGGSHDPNSRTQTSGANVDVDVAAAELRLYLRHNFLELMTGLGERVEMSVGISGGHEGADRAGGGGGVFARQNGERVDIPGLDGLVAEIESHEEVSMQLNITVSLANVSTACSSIFACTSIFPPIFTFTPSSTDKLTLPLSQP